MIRICITPSTAVRLRGKGEKRRRKEDRKGGESNSPSYPLFRSSEKARGEKERGGGEKKKGRGKKRKKEEKKSSW